MVWRSGREWLPELLILRNLNIHPHIFYTEEETPD